jgi:hypothetical protein
VVDLIYTSNVLRRPVSLLRTSVTIPKLSPGMILIAESTPGSSGLANSTLDSCGFQPAHQSRFPLWVSHTVTANFSIISYF